MKYDGYTHIGFFEVENKFAISGIMIYIPNFLDIFIEI